VAAPASQQAIIAPNRLPAKQSSAARAAATAPAASSNRMMISLLVGGGLLLLGAIVLVVILLSGGDSSTKETAHNIKDDTEDVPDNPVIVKKKEGKKTPPLDPHQKKINEAVERGVKYLKARLLSEDHLYYCSTDGGLGGAHVGAVALAALTLLECGVPPTDPAVQKAIGLVHQQAPTLQYTYSLAVSILFLDRLNECKDRKRNPRDSERIRDIALQLIAAQNSKGGWSYNCMPLSAAKREALLNELKNKTFVPGSYLKAINPDEKQYDDNSINQFVMLALWSSRKHGVPAEATLKKVEERYRGNQNPNGSWGYQAKDNGLLKDATTCCGLIGLAVGRGVELDSANNKKAKMSDLLKDKQVSQAFEYLSRSIEDTNKIGVLTEEEIAKRRKHTDDLELLHKQHFEAKPENREAILKKIEALDNAKWYKGTYMNADAWGDLYFLWSVERVGVIYDQKGIGKTNWFDWGSKIILKHQQSDGSWKDRFPGVPDTCFALLFLKRVNVVKDLTDKLRGEPTIGAPSGGTPNNPMPGKKE
jgi:hypothetical protein